MPNWTTRLASVFVSLRRGAIPLRTLSFALAASAPLIVSAEESSAVYDANCSLCHQRAGAGVKGQFPRLAGRTREIAATPAGRRLLIEVALFGMGGKIDVDGAPIIGVMPGLPALSDADIASVLNYLLRLEGPPSAKNKKKAAPTAITVQEVGEVRAGPQLSPAQVLEKRQSLLEPKKKK